MRKCFPVNNNFIFGNTNQWKKSLTGIYFLNKVRLLDGKALIKDSSKV